MRRYPVAHTDHDPRFTTGLVLDVARVLEQHGYPGFRGPFAADNAADLVELQQALLAFLYTGGGESA
nr:hypothetical protein [Halopolyspora algeriensis]